MPLGERPNAIGRVATWNAQEWVHLFPNFTVADYERDYAAIVTSTTVPFCFVAIDDAGSDEGGDVIGMVSLLVDDELPGFRECSPWLASLYVTPEHRHGGIGRALVDATVHQARRCGVANLYLYTEHQRDWYASMGWTAIASTTLEGFEVTVMMMRIESPGC